MREAEVDYLIEHLDKFLTVDQRSLKRLMNNTKYFSRLIDRVAELLGNELSKVNSCGFCHRFH